MLENGDLVTVSNAHPEHFKWFGIVLCNNKDEPNKFTGFRNIYALDKEKTYYVVFGPGFELDTSKRYFEYCFIDSNLTKVII